jgi:hypothetical protein
MSDVVHRIAAAVCCLGMGVLPVLQHYGCCCAATTSSLVSQSDSAPLHDCCSHNTAPTIPQPNDDCQCPVAAKSLNAAPLPTVTHVDRNPSGVDAVLTSALQFTITTDQQRWEALENPPPPKVARHVLFCTFLE